MPSIVTRVCNGFDGAAAAAAAAGSACDGDDGFAHAAKVCTCSIFSALVYSTILQCVGNSNDALRNKIKTFLPCHHHRKVVLLYSNSSSTFPATPQYAKIVGACLHVNRALVQMLQTNVIFAPPHIRKMSQERMRPVSSA